MKVGRIKQRLWMNGMPIPTHSWRPSALLAEEIEQSDRIDMLMKINTYCITQCITARWIVSMVAVTNRVSTV